MVRKMGELSSELSEELQEALKRLSYRQRQILSLHFGLEDGHEYTYQELAKNFRCTRERMRQIIEKALKKLRRLQPELELQQLLVKPKETLIVPKSCLTTQARLFKDFFCLEEVAALLNVAESTVRNWIRYGKFPKPDRMEPDGHEEKLVQRWSQSLVQAWKKLHPNPKGQAVRPSVAPNWRKGRVAGIDIDHEKFYISTDITRLVGKSEHTIRRWIKKEKFPKPVKNYKQSNIRLWDKETVDRWIEEKVSISESD